MVVCTLQCLYTKHVRKNYFWLLKCNILARYSLVLMSMMWFYLLYKTFSFQYYELNIILTNVSDRGFDIHHLSYKNIVAKPNQCMTNLIIETHLTFIVQQFTINI